MTADRAAWSNDARPRLDGQRAALRAGHRHDLGMVVEARERSARPAAATSAGRRRRGSPWPRRPAASSGPWPTARWAAQAAAAVQRRDAARRARTWRRAGSPASGVGGCPQARARVLIPAGVIVGALTGLVGVGGGFVVVPALAIGLSFGMREAIEHLDGHRRDRLALRIARTSGRRRPAGRPDRRGDGRRGRHGALLGPRFADRISTRALGQGFAVLVVLVALGVAGATVAGVSV